MIINNCLLWPRRLTLFIVIVITANLYTTHGQSYLLTIGHNPHIYFDRELLDRPNENHSIENNGIHSVFNTDQDGQNSTIILIKKTVDTGTSDLSKAAMDVITIIWYVATFLALAAFFFLMACNATRRLRAGRNTAIPPAPPTPSPSYSEFAPPSYESVIKKENTPSIYVIPFPLEEEKLSSNANESTENGTSNSSSKVTFYTLNELDKLGS